MQPTRLTRWQPAPAFQEIFLLTAHPWQFMILICLFKITCAFLPCISHCHTVSDIAQKQELKLKPGALRLKRKNK
jgi:hypothetical protein